MKAVITAGTVPMPNQIRNSGSSANFGMGRIAWMGGSSTARVGRCMPISRPSGTPMRTQNENAVAKRWKLTPTWCPRLRPW